MSKAEVKLLAYLLGNQSAYFNMAFGGLTRTLGCRSDHIADINLGENPFKGEAFAVFGLRPSLMRGCSLIDSINIEYFVT